MRRLVCIGVGGHCGIRAEPSAGLASWPRGTSASLCGRPCSGQFARFVLPCPHAQMKRVRILLGYHGNITL